APPPVPSGSYGYTYNTNLPTSLLHGSEIWLQVRMQSSGGIIYSSFSGAGVVRDGPAFAFDAVVVPSPSLSVQSGGGDTLTLSWPTSTGAFAVQQNPGLAPSQWTTLTNTPVVVGAQNHVTVPKTQSGMFFRLISQ